VAGAVCLLLEPRLLQIKQCCFLFHVLSTVQGKQSEPKQHHILGNMMRAFESHSSVLLRLQSIMYSQNLGFIHAFERENVL
jgi:hypothetical protein